MGVDERGCQREEGERPVPGGPEKIRRLVPFNQALGFPEGSRGSSEGAPAVEAILARARNTAEGLPGSVESTLI